MSRYTLSGLIFGLVLLMVSTQCITTGEPFSGLPPGIWRGVLFLDQGTQKSPIAGAFDEKSGAELPFHFEVIYDTPDSFHLELILGSQKVRLDDIRFGLDRSTGKDTVEIELHPHDSYLKARYEEDAIEGEWIVRSREEYRIPFRAIHSKDYLFTEMREQPMADISGRWDVQLAVETGSPVPADGLFRLEGNHLSAEFGTEDLTIENLEGTVQGERLFLAAFDGLHAYLLEAKILDDGSLSGIMRDGSQIKHYWSATRPQ